MEGNKSTPELTIPISIVIQKTVTWRTHQRYKFLDGFVGLLEVMQILLTLLERWYGRGNLGFDDHLEVPR